MICSKMRNSIFLFFILVLLACNESNKKYTGPDVDDCVGCAPPRNFSIDQTKSEFVVNVFGRKMGTPDWQTIDNFLKAKRSSSDIDELTVLATGFEGGASYCVAVRDQTLRTAVLNDLQTIPTDLTETAFSIESTDNCNEL